MGPVFLKVMEEKREKGLINPEPVCSFLNCIPVAHGKSFVKITAVRPAR